MEPEAVLAVAPVEEEDSVEALQQGLLVKGAVGILWPSVKTAGHTLVQGGLKKRTRDRRDSTLYQGGGKRRWLSHGRQLGSRRCWGQPCLRGWRGGEDLLRLIWRFGGLFLLSVKSGRWRCAVI